MLRRIHITGSLVLVFAVVLVACGVTVSTQTNAPTRTPVPLPTGERVTPGPITGSVTPRPTVPVTEVPATM
jgi:hypothetical protein